MGRVQYSPAPCSQHAPRVPTVRSLNRWITPFRSFPFPRHPQLLLPCRPRSTNLPRPYRHTKSTHSIACKPTMLLDRAVQFIDEVTDEIKRGGVPSFSEIIDRLDESLRNRGISRDAYQREMQAEMSRFQAEVEEPAAAILRERKAPQPSAVKKVEVALSGVDDGDAAFCRRLLEDLEPELEVAEPPRLSSLTLRVSLRDF
jgi:dsDNA-binding SOS-regulon protein